MRIAWLHDEPAHRGGAELTQAEFRNASPEGVEVIESPPGADLSGLDAAVVHNCMSYPADTLQDFGGLVFRYHHDVARAPLDQYLDEQPQHIFCSPLQRDRLAFVHDGPCIPPALDLEQFRQTKPTNGHRKGAVCIGRMSYGKGLERLAEYDEPVDVYSTVPVASEGSIRYQGATEDVAETLSAYSRFVFLPSALEPFGRAVVEAWAAGLALIVNRNVGARYWIREKPEALETAAQDFWAYVTG